MTFDFDRYVADFNAAGGREAELVDAYFTDDMILDGPDRSTTGKAPWIELLKFSHDGVEERLKPLSVVRQGDRIMAELDAQFTASRDRPDFLVHPLKAGDVVSTRFFAAYTLRDEKISRLALSWWPVLQAPE